MAGDPSPSPSSSPVVTTYTHPPPDLLALLRTHHTPHALPLLRRLHFALSPRGIFTEHARILFCSASGQLSGGSHSGPFAAAYVDFSRGPETELWLYSSLERRTGLGSGLGMAVGSRSTTAPSGGPLVGGPGGKRGEEEEEQEQEQAARCARALLREVKTLRAAYYSAYRPNEKQQQPATVLAGTLNETLRLALLNQGLSFSYVSIFDKWMFRLDALPDVASPLEPDMAWDTFHREDIPLMQSRTNILRKERTIVFLPSMAVYRDDGRPIAWALLGPDSSLSGLHCEDEWRGKGFAKAVAVKILRERLKDYDDDGHCWADVAPDNPKSQGVCKSLGGKVAWTISWSKIDLDRSFPDA